MKQGGGGTDGNFGNGGEVYILQMAVTSRSLHLRLVKNLRTNV